MRKSDKDNDDDDDYTEALTAVNIVSDVLRLCDECVRIYRAAFGECIIYNGIDYSLTTTRLGEVPGMRYFCSACDVAVTRVTVANVIHEPSDNDNDA